jgi:hypothetical protein
LLSQASTMIRALLVAALLGSIAVPAAHARRQVSAPARREPLPSDTLRARIADLNRTIADLEAQNGQTVGRALQLRSDIRARRVELHKRQRSRRILGLLGTLYGRPSLTAMGMKSLIDDDARLRQLSQELAEIEAERSRLQAEILAHAARRVGLERELARLATTD